MLEIGSVIDGKYKILYEIGRGGMSIVYLAINEKANKQWAVKELRKDGRRDYEVVRQGLIAEVEILKRLNHPNLPSIVDIIDRDETFLVVMDYIEGRSLEYWVKKEGAQPQELVIEWMKKICDVFRYLHAQDPPIIYRDLKPGNIMLMPNGDIKIIDFGTAREYKEESVSDTTFLGTQGYAAPEQYGGRGQTDVRTDIYTLGATMYHLLTGQNPALPPYEIRPIRELDPTLSSGLEQIIMKCTKRNPDERYQDCGELMYALEHYEEFEDSYRKKHRKRLTGFITTIAAAAAALCIALGFLYAADRQSIKEQSEKMQKILETANDLLAHETGGDVLENYEAYIAAYGDEVSYLHAVDALYYDEDTYAAAADDDNEDDSAQAGYDTCYMAAVDCLRIVSYEQQEAAANDAVTEELYAACGSFFEQCIDDGELDPQTEYILLAELFTEIGDAYKKYDPEEYAMLCYDIGLACSCYYSKNASGYALAQEWFDEAEEAATEAYVSLPDELTAAAGAYGALADYYNAWMGSGWADSEWEKMQVDADYVKLWEQMNVLLDTEVLKALRTERSDTVPFLYRELLYLLQVNTENFADAGITEDEMTQMLDRIGEGLTDLADEDKAAASDLQTAVDETADLLEQEYTGEVQFKRVDFYGDLDPYTAPDLIIKAYSETQIAETEIYYICGNDVTNRTVLEAGSDFTEKKIENAQGNGVKYTVKGTSFTKEGLYTVVLCTTDSRGKKAVCRMDMMHHTSDSAAVLLDGLTGEDVYILQESDDGFKKLRISALGVRCEYEITINEVGWDLKLQDGRCKNVCLIINTEIDWGLDNGEWNLENVEIKEFEKKDDGTLTFDWDDLTDFRKRLASPNKTRVNYEEVVGIAVDEQGYPSINGLRLCIPLSVTAEKGVMSLEMAIPAMTDTQDLEIMVTDQSDGYQDFSDSFYLAGVGTTDTDSAADAMAGSVDYRVMFFTFLCIALAFAVISVILFFALRIRQAAGYLSGRAQRKELAGMRQTERERQDIKPADRTRYSRLTSGDLYKTPSGNVLEGVHAPEEFGGKSKDMQQPEPEEKADGQAETELLYEGKGDTEVLNESEETDATQPYETARLYRGGHTQELYPDGKEPEGRKFILTKNTVEVHSDEEI